MRQPWKELMKGISDRGNSKFKDPEVGGGLLGLINCKILVDETSWAGRMAFVGAWEVGRSLFLFWFCFCFCFYQW